jgi:hypothetical protein
MNLIFDSKVPIINENINKNESSDFDLEEGEGEEEDNEDKNSNRFSSDSSNLKENNNNNIKNKNDNKIFEFEEGTEEISNMNRNISGKNININENLNNSHYDRKKSREFEDSMNNRNNIINPIRRKRFNTDLGDKYKKSIFLEEKMKAMKNCLKLFSVLTELTDYKIEKYKWFDINKSNNFYNITKLIQNLDILPLYFIHNCGVLYYSKNKENNTNYLNSLASYMYFIQKLGLIFNYNDLYPDLNKKKNNDKEKYIIINQDSFSRINFNIINLTEKDEKDLFEKNNIILIYNENSEGYQIKNKSISEDKLKIFFIIEEINERFYKIQRKYNSKKKREINYIIDEIFLNEFIIDIENQSSIQMIINMIKIIDILLKEDNNKIKKNKNKIEFLEQCKDNVENINNEENKSMKSIILDNQNIIINDDYMSAIGNDSNNLNNFDLRGNYIDENELMNDNNSSLQKRYLLISKL